MIVFGAQIRKQTYPYECTIFKPTLLVSGWYCFASLKYAFFTSALFADRDTPNTSYKSLFELDENERMDAVLLVLLGLSKTTALFDKINLPPRASDFDLLTKPPNSDVWDIMWNDRLVEWGWELFRWFVLLFEVMMLLVDSTRPLT